MVQWQLHEGRAILQSPFLSVEIDPAQPAAGWQHVRAGQRPLGGRFLGLRSPKGLFGSDERLLEWYVRGDDLVATYEERSDRPLRPQVYWRALPADECPEGHGIEVIVSMQTHLLDSDPGLCCETDLAVDQLLACPVGSDSDFAVVPTGAGAAQPLSASGLLYRLAGERDSFAVFVHPGDWVGGTLDYSRQGEGGCRARHTFLLFGERLEKGVIRRVRLRGILLPRERDIELAGIAAVRFAASRLPLTT